MRNTKYINIYIKISNYFINIQKLEIIFRLRDIFDV